MFELSNTLIAVLIALPVISAQSTSSTDVPATTTNSTNTTTAASTPTTFTPTNFTPAIALGTTCGTTQQNFNQCIVKVGKDISSCTDNVCLCQTYANIATCYNGCAELAPQGEAYQSQSTQYCSIAGVKPNTTAAAVAPVSNNVTSTSSASTTSNTSPARNSAGTNSTSNASTFSAAKGSGSSNLAAPVAALFAGFVAALAAVIA